MSYDLPREKAESHGVQNLTEPELLQLILGSGTAKKSVRQLSQSLLKKAGGLSQLSQWQLADYMTLPGIGLAGATRLQASFELHQRLTKSTFQREVRSPHDAVQEVKDILAKHREYLVVLYLNARHQVLSRQVVAVGSLNTSLVHPRDVFGTAMAQPCYGIILCHNHPSGNPEPSQGDVLVTKQIIAAGELLGIVVLDHIVVGHQGWVSLRERGFVQPPKTVDE